MNRPTQARAVAVIGALLLIGFAAPLHAEPPGDLPTTGATAGPRFADFNGDGYSDLAVAGDRDPEDSALEGVVRVRYGSKDGLTSASSQTWTADSFGSDRDDEFGSALATGDFDGDGYTDLAVGCPYAPVGAVTTAGLVRIIYGSRRGLNAARSQVWSQFSAGVPGTAGESDFFGSALTAANFGRGLQDDLAIGSPDDDEIGSVTVIYGSAKGLTATDSQEWSQRTPRIPGTPERWDDFGAALTAGNFGRTALADLAIGAPGEKLGGTSGAGAVNVIYGSSSGLTAAGTQRWSAGTPGVPGRLVEEAAFGKALVAGHFGGTAYDDLAIGAPDEPVAGRHAAGAVTVVRGSAAGLTARGSQRWTQATKRIAGKPGVSDGFGWSLAAANFGRDDRGTGIDDLAVGIPGETVGGRTEAGAVQVIYGSTTGLTGAGSRKLSRATAGVLGPARREAQFGWTLTAGEFGRTRGGEPMADLVATGMDEGVNVLYGAESGLSTRRDQYLTRLGFVLPGN